MHDPADDGRSPQGGLVQRVFRRIPVLQRLAISRVGPVEQIQAELREGLRRTEDGMAEMRELLVRQQHNTELLKGELWDTRVQITDFARQLSADEALVTAGSRLADLKDAVGALERRMRGIDRPAAAAPSGPSSAPAAGPAPEITSTLFDYVGFERRFRGDPDVINGILHERYASVLREHQPVVDIGCGRGELLELLARDGIEVIGVEPDPGMAAEARARGITVHEMLASDYFATVPDGSLGTVISTHVVEHLSLEVLIDFLERSAEKLRPGGVFIAETPNPATLIVLGSHFIMDPTHVWPLHPDLLVFLCESAGFREVRAEFFAPAQTMHLPLGDGTEGGDSALARRVDEGFARLNHVLFGPQDYAVFATVGPGGSAAAADESEAVPDAAAPDGTAAPVS
jgi:SAM-dependent methyltransferase